MTLKSSPPYHVLILCTGNSARSILGEALINHLGKGKFIGHSAGSHPKGDVHPAALAFLQKMNLPTQGLRSKSWDEFSQADAPQLDFVFTVCDAAADEVCPVWLGAPIKAHWGLPDPAAVIGTDAEIMAAFENTFKELEFKIKQFTDLPIPVTDHKTLEEQVRAIGRVRLAA